MQPGREHPIQPMTVGLSVRGVSLLGDLTLPREPAGIIVFAHGSGSSRTSPRNRTVARALVANRLATLLFDLLTREEEFVERNTRHLRFDIPLLADRLVGAIDWLKSQRVLGKLPIGLFGASTGAAAALIAATRTEVDAIVSRGGRPDLAGDALAEVRCPTLLIVGGDDHVVIDLNRQAMARMSAPTSMHVVPHAGHLFEEPGAMQQVIDAASAWFRTHLARPRRDEHAEHWDH